MHEFSHSKSLPMLLEATDYLRLFYREHAQPESHLQARLAEVYQECRRSQTYWQTPAELAYGAKVAWRNSTNCIGRIFWQSLTVRDLRHLTTAQEIFAALLEHIELATNNGSIRPYISIFAPQQPGKKGIRIWNPQLIRYAGYRQADGSVMGDPEHCELTEICQHFGWIGRGTQFDVLPVIIQMPDCPPQWFEIPSKAILEVPISHPDYPWFADLGLKWHALPSVSDWRLEIGGVSYPTAPFSGWYMGTEIGARNLGDVHRYNLLPIVAEKMGLNTRSKLSLWKDQALVALNMAVLYSFAQQGVSIVDHHTASSQFIQHMEREAQAGRMVPADWGRIVPPMSASATGVFHREMENVCLKPNFFSQEASYSLLSV